MSVILIVAQYVGCGFHWIALHQPDSTTGTDSGSSSSGYSWLVEKQLQDAPLQEKYVASVYWAIITMATIGYGDISPVTMNERIYVSVMTLVSSGLFGYVLNSSKTPSSLFL